MAKVIFSPLIAAMSGLTADAVFSSWKGIAYVRQHVIPANPQTDAQTAVRNSLAECVALWHMLSAVLKDGYENGADQVGVSGYNDFVGRNRAAVQAETGLYGPRRNTEALEPYILIPTDMDFHNHAAEGQARMGWTDTEQGEDYYVGYLLYDATDNLFAAEALSAQAMAAGDYMIVGLTPGHLYLMSGWVYRASDAEIVHCCTDADTIT